MTEEHSEEELSRPDKISSTNISDTDQIVSSRLSTPRECIGIHISLDTKITFFLYNEIVQAEVSGVDELVSVELPELLNEYIPRSVSTKVKHLLQNFHLYPVYQSNPLKKVYFKQVPPEHKTWQKQNIKMKVPENLKWICRRNNTISYAYANTVITWNWTDNTSILTSYETMKITALAENVEGDLIVGDGQGRLFISGPVLPTGKQSSITNIIQISSTVYLLKFEDDTANLFDIAEKKPIPLPNTNEQEKFRMLDNGMLVRWYNSEVSVLNYDPAKKQWDTRITKEYPDINDIRAIPNARFLIEHSDGTGTLWDIRKEISSSKKSANYVFIVKNYIDTNLLLLDKETLIYCTGTWKNMKLTFFRSLENGEDEITHAEPAGIGGSTSMIWLSDGSIMYATCATPSGIHIVTRDGKCVFSQGGDLTDNNIINSLKELSDGSVAVEGSSYIFILKPKMRDVTENIDYQIQHIKLVLQTKWDDLELYLKLVKLFIEKGSEQDQGELYQVYLSGLEAAVKSNHLYQARRFYEKSRQIQPNSEEPCKMFLSYLEITPYKQLTRRIHLDLSALTNNPGGLLDSLKSRRCKRRLLIGEGNFSYTEALIEKHKVTHLKLSKAIIATDWTATHRNDSLRESDKQQVENRIMNLKQRGVCVYFNINAEEIHQTFKGERFKRIQWNCPFGESSPNEREKFKGTIPRFFRSCSQLQLPYGRVHVTLMQKSNSYWKTRQLENQIVLGSVEAGYRLIRKRSFLTFDSKRYPEYVHVKTGTTTEYSSGGEEQEFIFEKTDKVFKQATLQDARALMDPGKKKYEINSDERNPSLTTCYFECSTDEDSSDYYESDSDEVL